LLWQKGWIIIFEGDGALVDERHPSAVVHASREKAEAARDRLTQVGKHLDIIEIDWDDSRATKPW
jgi:hypothetical protein